MRIVVALGGNALLRRGEALSREAQARNVEVAAEAIAGIAQRHEVILTHGNGPQIGLLATEQEAAGSTGFGLDVLGAESQAMIGFLLEQALRRNLPDRTLAGLLTTVLVNPSDPGFARPEKPIGPVLSATTARRLARTKGWTIAADGTGFRRVVPSPRPLRILEIDAIRILVEAGVLVICAGGGGVPVAARPGGGFDGVEGVVDKDHASALLARDVGAERLVLLTDVEGAFRDWGTPDAALIDEASPALLRALAFATGSMGPKVEAACDFVERTGGVAVIGSLDDAEDVVEGRRGTVIAR